MNRLLFFMILLTLLILLTAIGVGCSNDTEEDEDKDNYTIASKYTRIRSYRDGGGVFIVSMTPSDDFSGEVALNISTDPALNAELDRHSLDRRSTIAEIAIYPDQSAKIENYEIGLEATRISDGQSIILGVEMFDWGSGNINDAMAKRDQILSWVEAEYPDLGNFSKRYWFPYMTYPETLVVEHWTFLNMEWEMRLCYHVMIPPHDWSMLAIRRRGESDFIFAVRRESDGTTYEVPVTEYPTMYGY